MIASNDFFYSLVGPLPRIPRMTDIGASYIDSRLMARLPSLPAVASVPKPDKVCVIEWLSDGDKRTGYELHKWLEKQYPAWSSYYGCGNKREFLDSIDAVTQSINRSLRIPFLHLEAHGNEQGLSGASEISADQFATWDELVEPLQALNLGTRCNLIIFVSACVGFAGIQAFKRGPRAPAVAMAGPDSNIGEKVLLRGTKELYRRLCDADANLTDAAESASREIHPVGIEIEPLACMAFEALVSALVNYDQNTMPPVGAIQSGWNELFMIDVEPSNTERFGIDMSRVREVVVEWLSETEKNGM